MPKVQAVAQRASPTRSERSRAVLASYVASNPRPGPSRSGAYAAGVAGVLGLAVLAGYRWWRARKTTAAQVSTADALTDLGIALPSWLIGGSASSNHYDLMAAASKQVKLAKNGQRLSDMRQAEDLSLFWSTAGNNAHAYAKSAYWLALASRLTGSNVLGKAGASNLAKSTLYAATPDLVTSAISASRDGDITAIYAAAADLVESEDKEGRAKAVLAVLRSSGAPGAVSTAKKGRWETSAIGIGVGTAQRGAEDVFVITQVMRGVVTGEAPTGWSTWKWAAWKWGIRGSIALGVVAAVRVLFWKEWNAAREVVGSTARAVAGRRSSSTTVPPREIQRVYDEEEPSA